MADIDNAVGYTLGFSQANIERIAAGIGVPWRLLAARVGTLLQHSEGGPILGSESGMPELRGEARQIGSEDIRREVPESGSVAVAGHASRPVRRITKNSHANGELKPGLLLLHFLNQKGKTRISQAVHGVQNSHPKIKTAALRSAIERYITTGKLKKAADGQIKVTSPGRMLLTKGTVKTRAMSAQARARISAAQKKRWKNKKTTAKRTTRTLTLQRKAPTRERIIEVLRSAATPLRRGEIVKLAKQQYPDMTEKAVYNSLDNGTRNGFFVHTGEGYTLTLNALAASA